MARLPDTIPAGPVELRRWRADDVEGLVEAVTASLPELRQWMPWAHEPATTEVYAPVLAAFDVAFDEGTEFVFGMFEPSTSGVVVGGCGLHLDRRPRVAEVGYWVRSDRHRLGYASAAARALTSAAFTYLDDVDEVHITMDKANTASAGVPAKLGFDFAGEEERDVVAPGSSGRTLRWVTRRVGRTPADR